MVVVFSFFSSPNHFPILAGGHQKDNATKWPMLTNRQLTGEERFYQIIPTARLEESEWVGYREETLEVEEKAGVG